jgi:CMP-N,N'-diacetyllegionaminic acid synthase
LLKCSTKVLGVVTARRGSRAIPGKNVRPLLGKPLIAYTFEAAVGSGAFDRLVLSSDDPACMEIARRCGCDVPFTRPAALAADETPHLPVMQHAVRWLEEHEGYRPDAVMILQPTSPARQPHHIREAIALLERSGADSVVSVSEIPVHYHPLRALRVDDTAHASLFVTGEPVRRRINRRQELPPAWVFNGAIYLFRTHTVLNAAEPSLYGNRVVTLSMPDRYSVSIDGLEDWAVAERALAEIAADTASLSGSPRQP